MKEHKRIPLARIKHREEFYSKKAVAKRSKKSKCEKRGHHRYTKFEKSTTRACLDCDKILLRNGRTTA